MALRACGFVIFRRLVQKPSPDNIEFLLLQASYGEHHWTPPKVLRMVDGFLQKLHYQVRGKNKEVLYWLAELRDPNTQVVLSDEHQDYRWAKLEEACKLVKHQDFQDTLKAAQRYIETQGKQ